MLLSSTGLVDEVRLDHSPPLGLGVDPVTAHGTLISGDHVLMFTDGLIEARSPSGGFVDPAPFLPGVATAAFDTALDGLLASLKQGSGSARGDDLALLLARYEPNIERGELMPAGARSGSSPA